MKQIALVGFLAACGDDGGALPDAVVDGPWRAGPSLPSARQETAAVAVDRRVYVLGGFDLIDGITAEVDVLSQDGSSWYAGPRLPEPVHHATATVLDDTIYVLGSLVGSDFAANPDVWSYAPATDSGWSARAPLPNDAVRGAAVAGAIDGRIYLAGGYRGGAVDEVSIYDPVADAWTAGPPLPAPLDHACGAAIDGRLYVAGGRDDGILSSALHVLDPATGWSTGAPMPTARAGAACGVVDGRLVVVGGEGNPDAPSGVFAEAESYDPVTDSWTSLPPMPTPRHGMGAATRDGALHVPGGADRQGFGAVATHEVLVP